MTRKQTKPELCYAYYSDHPLWDGEPSMICYGCTNYDPRKVDDPKYVSPLSGEINCKNFRGE